ncbi:MAG TPA: DNA polymerase III subunit delta [Clostridiaceae bacterium]|nr:DNA polymerase III subunit delta [Clostridiaceae bacterium]
MTKYNFRTIKKEIDQGIWHQGYLIYGEEKYLIKQIIDLICRRFVAAQMQDIDLVKIAIGSQLSDADIERIKQELKTPPFMSERKVILIENTRIFARAVQGQSEVHKKNQEEFSRIFPLLNPGSCLIIHEATVDGRLKKILQNWFEAGGVQVEIGREEINVLRHWLQAKAQQKKLGLTVEAADNLIDRCESDMTQIEQEFSKALLYAEYAGLKGIDLATIDLVCKSDVRGTVFDLTDAVSAGKTDQALKLLDTLLVLKEPLPLIRFMFTRHIKQLICAKELGNEQLLIKKIGVYPFVARRLLKQARNMSLDNLEHFYRLAFESDWKVKRGHMTDRLSFETLLIEASLTFASKVS